MKKNSNSLSNTQNLWILKSVSDAEKSYKTVESYNDEVSASYNYDSKVANSKRIKAGDNVILVNKHHVLGFAKLETINEQLGEKVMSRCMYCQSTTIEARKNLTPKYRCNKGHIFEEPRTETVKIIKYFAQYRNTFIPVTDKHSIDIKIFRTYYLSGYNRNMSMQLLDMGAMKLFPNILDRLGSNDLFNNVLDANFAEDTPDYDDNFVPVDNDEREVIKRQIKARRGQQKFRNDLQKRYGTSCMVSGCKILDILEAAHIKPYRGIGDNHVSNGLLLRADIHTLFDLNLLGIDPESFKINISKKLLDSEYSIYHGKSLITCAKKPSKTCLENRWHEFNSTEALNAN